MLPPDGTVKRRQLDPAIETLAQECVLEELGMNDWNDNELGRLPPLGTMLAELASAGAPGRRELLAAMSACPGKAAQTPRRQSSR